MLPLDLESLRRWIGRTDTGFDIASPAAAALLAATLNRHSAPKEGDPLPLTWHWLYFLPPTASNDLGEDGMPRRGGFMPPVSLPRRMWAGSRIELREPIRLGDRLQRRTTIADVTAKDGRSGALVFVRVVTELATERGTALIERRDVVFRDHPSPTDPAPRPQAPPKDAPMWREEASAGPVLLFRYSALTFNAHRIHYDEMYATKVEGYPGLVVQGPLLATLLAESLDNHVSSARIGAITFRAVGAVFAEERFTIAGKSDSHKAMAWAVATGDNRMAMTAEAEIE